MQTVVLIVVIVAGFVCCGEGKKTDCSNVKCAIPECDVGLPHRKPNACCGFYCPKNGNQGKSCKNGPGKPIKHGESIKDECNTCYCNDGDLLCTEKACNPCTGDNDGPIEGGNPCMPCSCYKGQLQCAVIDCLPCKGEVKPPEGQCCPECPCIDGEDTYQHGDDIPNDKECIECKCEYGQKVCKEIILQCFACRKPEDTGCCPLCP